jgi:hypothetical protein
LQYLLGKALVNKVPAASKDLYGFMDTMSFVNDGELTPDSNWAAYRTLPSRAKSTGAPISHAGCSPLSSPPWALSPRRMLASSATAGTVSFEVLAHACAMAQAWRDVEGPVPPTMLQSLPDCLQRYQSLTSSFAVAHDTAPCATLNAMHAVEGTGGSGSGSGSGGGGGGVAGPNRFF